MFLNYVPLSQPVQRFFSPSSLFVSLSKSSHPVGNFKVSVRKLRAQTQTFGTMIFLHCESVLGSFHFLLGENSLQVENPLPFFCPVTVLPVITQRWTFS